MVNFIIRVINPKYNAIRQTLEKITVGVGAVSILMGLAARVTIGDAALGALCGEILDRTPYLKHAIPDGLNYLAMYITPETAKQAKTALEGNLDKVGAAMGFIGGFYRSALLYRKK